jgi:putative nucleotidyltransferase with HDIG domain
VIRIRASESSDPASKSGIIALGIAVISIFLLTAALIPFSGFIPSPVLKEGDISPRNIKALDDLVVRWMGEGGPQEAFIKKGEMIVREGERVTKKGEAALLLNEKMRKKESTANQVGSIIVSLSLVLLVSLYLSRYGHEVLRNSSELALISLLPIIWLLLTKLLLIIPSFPKYIVPFATPSMLIAVLVDQRIAIAITIPFSLAFCIATGFEVGTSALALVGGTISASLIKGMRKTIDLPKAGVAAGLGGGILILAIDLMTGGWSGKALKDFLYALLGGIGSSIFAAGLLPPLELLLGMYTDARLLELSNLDHPLLLKLSSIAPGTYHHSVLVGNLAEAAATAVGANPILAKVGGYFHDIGKMMRPSYFTENMNGKRSKHEKLAPSLSSLILVSHVKDGVEMARRYKLPKPVIEIIQQHHGESLTYFYHKAKAEGNGEEVAEEVYRYPGPKPKTKEAALVMIADCVEAASRSIPNPSPSSISDLVEKIIEDKLEDGQLDECDLTMKDLHEISESMKRSLMAMMHGRIRYPDGSSNSKHIRKEDTDDLDKEGGKEAPGGGRG